MVPNRHIVRIIALFSLVLFTKAAIVDPLSAQNSDSINKYGISRHNSGNHTGAHPPFHEVIKSISKQHGIDYRLIYALIRQESRFDPAAVSEKGATGLMQVMPAANFTADNAIDEKDINLEDTVGIGDEEHIDLMVPETNIRAGVSYLASMMSLFENCSPEDRISLALAAYNAGPARVYDAQEIAAYMGDNPNSWPAVRNALPLLSMRYYSLHKSVWTAGKPRNGYFGGSRQTIPYVEHVMRYYTSYRQVYK